MRGCWYVVHVVVPDGLQVHAGGSDHHVQRLSLPLLQQSFSAVLRAAAGVGARSVAVPALGCGVNGWRPSLAAAAAARALVEVAEYGTLSSVDLVIGSDSMAQRWREALADAVGPPALAPAAAGGDGLIAAWQISQHQAASLRPLVAAQKEGLVSTDDASQRQSIRALREKLLLQVKTSGTRQPACADDAAPGKWRR
jgi:hypothetical protein